MLTSSPSKGDNLTFSKINKNSSSRLTGDLNQPRLARRRDSLEMRTSLRDLATMTRWTPTAEELRPHLVPSIRDLVSKSSSSRRIGDLRSRKRPEGHTNNPKNARNNRLTADLKQNLAWRENPEIHTNLRPVVGKNLVMSPVVKNLGMSQEKRNLDMNVEKRNHDMSPASRNLDMRDARRNLDTSLARKNLAMSVERKNLAMSQWMKRRRNQDMSLVKKNLATNLAVKNHATNHAAKNLAISHVVRKHAARSHAMSHAARNLAMNHDARNHATNHVARSLDTSPAKRKNLVTSPVAKNPAMSLVAAMNLVVKNLTATLVSLVTLIDYLKDHST